MNPEKALQRFVGKAKSVHGNGTYDYSQTVFTGHGNKVQIVCPVHGPFYQTTVKHIAGQGCRKCGCKRRDDARRHSTEEFVNKAVSVHCSYYDYSKVLYMGAFCKVELI